MSSVALFHGMGLDDVLTHAEPVAKYATPVVLGIITVTPQVPLWIRAATGTLVAYHGYRLARGLISD